MMRFAARGLSQEFRVYFQTMNSQGPPEEDAPRRRLFRRRPGRVLRLGGRGPEGTVRERRNQQGGALLLPGTGGPFREGGQPAGLQVELHAIGDAAVDQALTAYARALEDSPGRTTATSSSTDA
jgi:hypothetical protein